MSEQGLLSLFLDKKLCDDVVDVIIDCDLVSGFTFTHVNGYSREHASYDLREQVAGYRELLRLDILHQNTNLDDILRLLYAIKSNHPLRYWVTPITNSGVIK
jgi:hypothetical protein